MLLQLTIQNYALIDHLEFKPGAHLNILSGETGAGKSILLGALALILGDRADSSVILNKDKKCIVEAHFDVRNHKNILQMLKDADIDTDPVCIIRREVQLPSKSRAFVNDTPVNLQLLQKLSAQLVELHRQFDHHKIDQEAFQMELLDALAQNSDLLNQYQLAYKAYQELSVQIAEKRKLQAQWQQEYDYKQFLFEELEQAAFKEHEIETLEAQLKQLEASEKIISTLNAATYALEESDTPIGIVLKRIQQQFSELEKVFSPAKSIAERLNSVYIELKDIVAEIDGLKDNVDLSSDQKMILEDRLNLGIKLLKKHHFESTSDLILLHQKLSEELHQSATLTENIDALEQQKQLHYSHVQKLAQDLHNNRAAQVLSFEEQLKSLLAEVGMLNAGFKIELKQREQPNAHGMSQVSFWVDINNSGQFLTIEKSASGGERSRIALCVQSIVAAAIELPTLIFDEVDTGVSGEAAKKIAQLLHDLAQQHQIICITHQVQVAARGAQHFYVYKQADAQGQIKTNLKQLNQEEKINIIAQMIDGATPSAKARAHAQELIAGL